MNLLELESRILTTMHRADLSTQVRNWVADATGRINRRFNLELEIPLDPEDTNSVMQYYPLLYLYAALQAGYEYINNGDNATYYAQSWERECDRQRITQQDITDPYSDEPPIMRPI